MGGIDMKRYLTLVLLLALCLTACTPKAPAPTETAPAAGGRFCPVGDARPGVGRAGLSAGLCRRGIQRGRAGGGLVVSLRFVMPYIENAGENPVWRSLNEDFSILGEGWLEKGQGILGAPPGLEPGGDYSVESVYSHPAVRPLPERPLPAHRGAGG